MGDSIKKPDHYCDGRKYEPKDVIRDWGLNFNLGSAVKYISRAGRKGDKLEDLKKAKQFLEFEIEAEEDAQKKASKEAFDKSLEALDKCKAALMAKRKKRFTDLNTGKDIWLEIETDGNIHAIGDIDTAPDECKDRLIDYLAQEVLDNQCDVDHNIPTDEFRAAVIDRIVERINNGELDRMDIPTGLYEECGRIRAAIANREYRKMADAVKKYAEDAEDAEDTVSINFEFEVDPEIDTDTINVHVHIKNKED